MKSSPLKIRYVLISDYATIDHSGKLIVAGLYTEDLVVPSVPTLLGSLVLTVLAEAPANKLAFQINLVAPSGAIVIGGGGEVEPSGVVDGARARAILGFQFNQILLTEPGDYKLMLADASKPSELFEIHRFRLVVNEKAHSALMAGHVQASQDVPRDSRKAVRR